MKEAMDIIKVRNSKGGTSTIAMVYNGPYDALITARHADKPGIRYDDQRLGTDIGAYLEKNGFNQYQAGYIGEKIADGYRPERYRTNHVFPFYVNRHDIISGPHAVSRGIVENIRVSPAKPSEVCAALRLTNEHNGEQWTRSFVKMDKDPRSLRLPYELQKEFSQFFRDHEIAHCMGADEPEADRAAARLLLKNSKDIKKSLFFLNLMKSIRSTNLLFERPPLHFYGTFQSIDTAINDFKVQSGVTMSKAEIWTEALERRNYHLPQVVEIVQFAHGREDLVKAKDFAGMADYLRAYATILTNKDQKRLAMTMAENSAFFGTLIGTPPQPQLKPEP